MQVLSGKDVTGPNFYLRHKFACLARDASRIAKLEEQHSEALAGASGAGMRTSANDRGIALSPDRDRAAHACCAAHACGAAHVHHPHEDRDHHRITYSYSCSVIISLRGRYLHSFCVCFKELA